MAAPHINVMFLGGAFTSYNTINKINPTFNPIMALILPSKFEKLPQAVEG